MVAIMDWIMFHQNPYVKVLTPVPQNVTVFVDRVFKEVDKVN